MNAQTAAHQTSRTPFIAQFVGFTVEVTCQECGQKIGINNATPQKQMNKIIVKFRKEHEKAHKPS